MRPKLPRRRGAWRLKVLPSPFVVVAAAAVAGVLLARAIDWRSHAHPR